MLRFISILLASILFVTFSNGQPIHISGKVKISIITGTIEAALKMTNIPRIKDYTILLNTGLNVEYIADSSCTIRYNTEREFDSFLRSEALQYYIPSDKKGEKYIPSSLTLKYVGKYPVISDTSRRFESGDWKGNIAFNGKSLRVTEQSYWYPQFYDKINEKVFDKVTYELEIESDGCGYIFINGNNPVKAKFARLSSTEAIIPFMFIGNYNVKEIGETIFINSQASSKTLSIVNSWLIKIEKYYEENLQIPYKKSIYFVETSPTSESNEFQFVSYPTICAVGNQSFLSKIIDQANYQLKDSTIISFLMHELGHYYFGNVLKTNSSLQYVLGEGITEFISLKCTNVLLSNNIYKTKINKYLKTIPQKENYISLKKINSDKDALQSYDYSYNFIPLLFLCVEREIGSEKLWKWFKEMLQTKNTLTNYDFLCRTALRSGISTEEFTVLEEKYFSDESSYENVIKSFVEKLK